MVPPALLPKAPITAESPAHAPAQQVSHSHTTQPQPCLLIMMP